MKRSIFIVSCVAVVACLPATLARGQASKIRDLGEVLAGPAGNTDAVAWLAEVQQWRKEHRAAIRYDGADYARPELAWGQRSFIQPQMMVEERTFYDPVAGKYTVDRYLDDLETRYGGIDSVLIWPVYPNIGIDNRNQHDMLRAMPGGLAGVRSPGRTTRTAADLARSWPAHRLGRARPGP